MDFKVLNKTLQDDIKNRLKKYIKELPEDLCIVGTEERGIKISRSSLTDEELETEFPNYHDYLSNNDLRKHFLDNIDLMLNNTPIHCERKEDDSSDGCKNKTYILKFPINATIGIAIGFDTIEIDVLTIEFESSNFDNNNQPLLK